MKLKRSSRKLTKEQKREKLLRRKARQAEQKRFEKELSSAERAEKILPFLMLALFLLSFFLFADRACGGILSILFLLVEISHIIILCRFKTLWKKQFILILCTYVCSSVLMSFSCTIQSAVFSLPIPIPPALLIWLALLGAWLYVILRRSEPCSRPVLSVILIALSLSYFTVFGIDRVNISFDRSEPEPVTAEVILAEKVHGQRGYTYWITAEFPINSGETTSNRFCVLKTDHYEQLSEQAQITLLRHEGALGSAWYEIELPK